MKQRRLSGYRNLLVAGARGCSLNRGLLDWPTFIQFASSVLLPILSQRSQIRSFIFKASFPSVFITHFDLPSALIASGLECVILMTVRTLTPESLGFFRGPGQTCSPFLTTSSQGEVLERLGWFLVVVIALESVMRSFGTPAKMHINTNA